MSVDLLKLDAVGLQVLLEGRVTTSAKLVKQILTQIENEDQAGFKLNAMISVMPEQLLLSKAAELDEERKQGKVRGPLHGIPVIVKVCYYSLSEMLNAG